MGSVPASFSARPRRLSAAEVIVEVAGEVDIQTASQLEAEVDAACEAGIDRVFVDLSGCDFIDSSGIAALVRSVRRADGDSPLAIVGAGRQVRRVFEITALDQALPLFESLEHARSTVANRPHSAATRRDATA